MLRLPPTLAAILFVAGCSSGGGAPDTRPIQNDVGGSIVETVNGTPVPRALLDAVARARNLDLSQRDQRDQALVLLTDYVLLAQAARKNGFFADPKFRADVEAARLQGVGAATLLQMQAQAPLTDAVVKAEFDAQIARIGKVEYDFTQLLFDNSADALKACGDVIAGKSFDEVFKAWRSKAKQAKTYTRVRPDQLPEALAKALAGLKNGETTKVPVKTRFGWHVVHLDIVNPFKPPPFEQVKQSVRETMLRRVGQERLRQLKEQAKIEYAPGTEPPSPRSEGERPASQAPEKPASAAKKP